MSVVREFNVYSVSPNAKKDEMGPEWKHVVTELATKHRTKLEQMFVCEFGLGEEVIAIMFFANKYTEVGVGEAMRPYVTLYTGKDRKKGMKSFWNAVESGVSTEYY